MTALDDFDRAASTVTALVTAIGADQWPLPTACADWDVRAVVNHLAHGNAKVPFWAGTRAHRPRTATTWAAHRRRRSPPRWRRPGRCWPRRACSPGR
ncbi:maleylpyruvate isomerase N-terminal domain-containing protein [Amycolatopsis sp. NPDC026612]|uniref:maleylpyruvate isomerase N-terminal domain-containing protein n=1 Tax=Amycolatopsis sp. NPDC026612 TaxID=3155466 RepID=UPI0033D100EA